MQRRALELILRTCCVRKSHHLFFKRGSSVADTLASGRKGDKGSG